MMRNMNWAEMTIDELVETVDYDRQDRINEAKVNSDMWEYQNPYMHDRRTTYGKNYNENEW